MGRPPGSRRGTRGSIYYVQSFFCVPTVNPSVVAHRKSLTVSKLTFLKHECCVCVCECILGAVCHFFMTPNRLDCRNFLLFIFPPPKLDWLFFFTFYFELQLPFTVCLCDPLGVQGKLRKRALQKLHKHTHTRSENDTAAGKYVFPTRIKPKLIPPGKGTPTGVLRGGGRR